MIASWNSPKIKSRARSLPLKLRVRVLTVLNTRGERAAQTEFMRAERECNREPPHPLISHGGDSDVMEKKRNAQTLFSQGFGVASVARKLSLSKRQVRSWRDSLHKKTPTVPLCTPPAATEPQHLQPQVHKFTVEVKLPWESGTNITWRESLQKERVQAYKINKEVVSGYQEHYELTPQVSVRTTAKRIFLTVKNVYGLNFDDCEKKAWELVQDACVRLELIYGFEFEDKISIRFKGAEWALVNHEVAKVCHKVGIKPVTFQHGKKVIQVDTTPDKCIEFTKKEHGDIAYENTKDVVLSGLTQRFLATTLNEFMSTVKSYIEVQTQELQTRKGMPSKIDEEIIPKERPDYFG